MNTYSTEKFHFIMKVCGIKQQEIVDKMTEDDKNSSQYEAVRISANDKFRKTIKKTAVKKDTLLPMAEALIEVIKEKQQSIPLKSEVSIEEKIIMRFGDLVTEETFYVDSKYFKFYSSVRRYLVAENCLDSMEKRLNKRIIYYPSYMENMLSEDDILYMENTIREQQKEELRELIHSCREDGTVLAVHYWEQLVQFGRYCSNVDLPEFIADFKKTDFTKVMDKIDKECRLSPIEIMENAGNHSFLENLDFVSVKKNDMGKVAEKRLEERLEELMEGERGVDLDYLVPVFQNIDFITKDNMDILFKIACSMGGVVYGEGEIELDFEQD